jgi:hypothetical protein
LVTPIIAALMHTISSAIVVFNSARMVRYGEHIQSFVAPARTVAAETPQGRVALQAV